MHEKLERLHELIWSRLYQPATGLLYTFIDPRTRAPVLPTVDEILRCIPNTAGWQTPLEDNCLCAGVYIDAMLRRHAAHPTPQNERCAREIFRGLRNLSTCGRRRGFIARGLLPDGRTHYPDTLVDQYTMYLYGMWRYFHSPLATDEERAFIRRMISDICLQFEEDEFVIQTEAGAVATFGDINAMLYARVERVLQPFAIGWHITGNARFADVYGQLKAEQEGRRMRLLAEAQPPPKGRVSLYALLQTQIALRCLVEIEPDARDRAIYDTAMTRIARGVAPWIEQYREFDRLALHDDWECDWRRDWNARGTDNIWNFFRQLSASGRLDQWQHLGHAVREPVEGLLCQVLASDPEQHRLARGTWAQMLDTVAFDHAWDSDSVIGLELLQHLLDALA